MPFAGCARKRNGGDFLILRAIGDDDYNSYVNGICKLNSVATLVIPDTAAANDPAVADIIRHAEAVFIAGGNQARYVNFWHGTAVQDALNANIAGGKPIGGTSAGLAVLGQFSYGCLKDKEDDNDLASTDVLPNPYHERVTLVRDFLKVPIPRQRHSPTATSPSATAWDALWDFFRAWCRTAGPRTPRDIAIDEKSAVLVEPDGKSVVVGSGTRRLLPAGERRLPRFASPILRLRFTTLRLTGPQPARILI